MNKVLVLYYHRVCNAKDDPFSLCVNEEIFDQQMHFLRDTYRIERFEDAWTWDSKSVVITFDDGYEDNLTNALPILEKYQIPATIFISTGKIIERGNTWWDELYEIVVKNNLNTCIYIDDTEFGCRWDTSDREHKMNCFYAIYKLMNHYVSLEKKEDWMKQLRRQVSYDNKIIEDCKFLTPQQLLELSKSRLITIGGHTVSHMSLGKMEKNKQQIEIAENLRQLYEMTHKNVTVFSYPFGTPSVDYNNDTLEICLENGILKAATTAQKSATSEFNSLEIPRCEIKNWKLDEFKIRLDDYWRR